MAIKEIIQEVKTLSSRQVLILVLIASFYLNFELIRQRNLDAVSHAKEIKQLENEKSDLMENERKKTDDAIKSNIDYIKEVTKKTYEHEKFVDSIKLVNQLKK